jgi:hypothetical protein
MFRPGGPLAEGERALKELLCLFFALQAATDIGKIGERLGDSYVVRAERLLAQ